MTGDIAQQRLQEAWRECQRHVHHLRHALTSLEPELPLSGDRMAKLDELSRPVQPHFDQPQPA